MGTGRLHESLADPHAFCKAHFESGPYQLFSPNTAANNSITGNLSGVCLTAWVHPHFTVALFRGLQCTACQSQALDGDRRTAVLGSNALGRASSTSGFLVGLHEDGPWDLSASLGWGYARSSFTETPGVPLVYHQTGYPWVLPGSRATTAIATEPISCSITASFFL